MSEPFLMLVWATGDEARPLEYNVFDRYVASSLKEKGQGDDVAANFGRVIYDNESIVINVLAAATRHRFLVVTLDASKVRGGEAVRYVKDLQEIVEDARTAAGWMLSESVLGFESREHHVARGFLVPSTCVPTSTIEFAKEFKNCINDEMSYRVEKDLRAAVEEEFSLPNVERAALLERLFADLPEDFEGRSAALAEINDAFRQELAARLTPALNAFLKEAAPGDAEAKKQLASDVMEKLTDLGLAVRRTDTDQPSRLLGQQDLKNPKGRIAIVPKGTSRPSLTRTDVAELLPLQLVVDRPRREALNEWRGQATRQVSPPRDR